MRKGRHPINRAESNATSVRKCSNTDLVNQPREKVKEHRIDERKEFCCDQIMNNKDKNNQESQNNNNQNHLLEIAPIARKKRRKSL
jgi:glycerol-3-phosphate cytidylyltransferase-like family protein